MQEEKRKRLFYSHYRYARIISTQHYTFNIIAFKCGKYYCRTYKKRLKTNSRLSKCKSSIYAVIPKRSNLNYGIRAYVSHLHNSCVRYAREQQ